MKEIESVSGRKRAVVIRVVCDNDELKDLSSISLEKPRVI